jgi:hypothetical protein
MHIMSFKNKQLRALIEANNENKVELEGLRHVFEVALRRYHICSEPQEIAGRRP